MKRGEKYCRTLYKSFQLRYGSSRTKTKKIIIIKRNAINRHRGWNFDRIDGQTGGQYTDRWVMNLSGGCGVELVRDGERKYLDT